jgi:hypothetical protein
MKCKICGAPIIGSSPQLGAFVMVPTCKCGAIRKKQRKKGCPSCGTHGIEIQLHKKKGKYIFTCECGTIWEHEEE